MAQTREVGEPLEEHQHHAGVPHQQIVENLTTNFYGNNVHVPVGCLVPVLSLIIRLNSWTGTLGPGSLQAQVGNFSADGGAKVNIHRDVNFSADRGAKIDIHRIWLASRRSSGGVSERVSWRQQGTLGRLILNIPTASLEFGT